MAWTIIPERFDKEDALTNYLVPYVYAKDLDEHATKFLEKYCSRALKTAMPLPLDEILEAMQLKRFEAPLPDNIFVQTFFSPAHVQIIDERTGEVVEMDIEPGTILINPNVVFMRNIGSNNNTIIHECVHWDKHHKFFELQQLLNPGISTITCAVVEKYDKRDDGSLASELDWMEWQSNALAPRILMPASTTKQKLTAILRALHQAFPNTRDAEIMQLAISQLADFFQVSTVAAKIRAVELGFDQAAGVFNYVDGTCHEPFSFKRGTLKKNQTFVVDRNNAIMEGIINPEIAQMCRSGLIVHADGVFAINNPKFVTTKDDGSFILTDYGIECYFENENIWTFDGKGELLLTIMSSLAQEESRSISENCTWGQRKRFADGKVTVPFNRFLGYDRGPDGNLVVNREQAAIVQRIYAMFLQGMTYNGIAQQLTDDGILSPGGKPKWNTSAVKSILSNEKYKGCALLQKTYTVDYLTKKKKVNEGEIPQYYVEDNHEAIIDPDTFEMVQREMEKRDKGRKYHSGVHTFSSKIRCGECGSWYGSKVWHSNSKYRKVIWQCNHKFDGDKHCSTPHLTDDIIQQAFLSAANKLLATKDTVIADGREMMALLFDTTDLEREQEELQQETQVVSDMVQQCICENAHDSLDQTEYQKRYDGLTERFEKAKARLDAVTAEIHQMQTQRASIEDFLKAFAAMPDKLTEFTLESWHGLVDYGTVTLPTTSASPSKTGRKSKPDPRNENGSLPLEVISGSREFR